MAGRRLLHFAPEPLFDPVFARLTAIERVTADLHIPADLRLDITEMDLPDRSFELILCSHVLEHVPDDRAAMRELRRVTAAGGFALVMVPLALHRDTTYEDPSITTPEERERAFLQHDHVRLYAPDIADRLRSAGFVVETVDLHAELGPAAATRHGLLASDLIFLCRRA